MTIVSFNWKFKCSLNSSPPQKKLQDFYGYIVDPEILKGVGGGGEFGGVEEVQVDCAEPRKINKMKAAALIFTYAGLL